MLELQADLNRFRSVLTPTIKRARDAGYDIRDANELVALLERGRDADRLIAEVKRLRSALSNALADTVKAQGELKKLKAMLEEMSPADRAVLDKAADDDVVAAELDRLGLSADKPSTRLKAFLAANVALTGQNAQMRIELARLKGNGGTGLPYCWTTIEGRPIYMLKVQLFDSGVAVEDLQPRPRPDDPAWLALDAIPRATLMPIQELIVKAEPIQTLARAGRCRYAVLTVDSTGRTNKPGYKMLMGRLWSAFMVHEVAR
ncbi:MAG: hypothetical protein ACU0B1_09760 [Thermohalobaculum sp.]